MASGALQVLVARMPKYVFNFNNGFQEDHVLDLPDDTSAAEEGLKTASGMMSDLSLPRIGRTFVTSHW